MMKSMRSNFVDDSVYSGSDVDEIIPIHAELNAQDEGYSDEDYYYETEILPDTLESYEEEEMKLFLMVQFMTLHLEMLMRLFLFMQKRDIWKLQET